MPVTKQEAMTASRFTETSTGRTWRRNGQTQTWKRDPSRFRCPVKFGLYGYGQITESTAWAFTVQVPAEGTREYMTTTNNVATPTSDAPIPTPFDQ